MKEMNDYVRQFIVDYFENVLGSSVSYRQRFFQAAPYAAVESALPEKYKGMVKNEDQDR